MGFRVFTLRLFSSSPISKLLTNPILARDKAFNQALSGSAALTNQITEQTEQSDFIAVAIEEVEDITDGGVEKRGGGLARK